VRTLIVLLLFVPLGLLYIPIIFLSFIFRVSQPVCLFAKFGIKLSQWILGIRLEVIGLEALEKNQGYVLMSNHLSLLDGPMMYMLFPHQLSIILKQEILKVPIVGHAMRRVNFVPVDRGGIKAGRRSLDKAARLMREKKYSFLIFPEGTRSRDGKLQKFRRGGFFLALESGSPIAPVSIQGTFPLQPKGKLFIKKGRVRVIFHKPIAVGLYSKERMPELMEKVRAVVAAGIDSESTESSVGGQRE
jgi:1-acyl-sn-glycerol-3-phosphate acyltransferase